MRRSERAVFTPKPENMKTNNIAFRATGAGGRMFRLQVAEWLETAVELPIVVRPRPAERAGSERARYFLLSQPARTPLGEGRSPAG